MPARLTLRRPAVAVNAAIVVALAAGGFWAYRTLAGPGSTPAANAATRTVAVQRGTVTKTVTADGTVGSASTATAGFVTAGTVTSITVRVGQRVTKGQVLAKVDPAAAQRSLDAAEADLDAARDSLGRAEDAGESTDSAESAVTQAELAVDDAEAAVAGTVLKAPMAGTVTAVNGAVGSTSSGSGASQGGGNQSSAGTQSSSTSEGFVELQDLTKMQVTAAFPEADTTKIKERQAATVTWNALSGTSAAARVTAVDPSATTENNVVTYGVTLSLDKVPSGVRAGQTVSVAVTTGRAENALMVSSAAITTVGNRHSVTVVDGGTPQVRPVEIGLQGDSATQITSGLEAGERVVLRVTTPATSGAGTQGGFPAGGAGFPGGGPGGGNFGGGGGRGGR
ncbi:efflux RND transporter periplasmic adaptor subunit [Actinoplanes solisilvae]|uniref:efflux RND transporter periplasmic adaptor subunit n=1 Tax=Actinoplanes solisilvae TaxID=2486853 RepID=UPI000FD90D75|nr:HlyD family efflux transporter periplasmic adaptor subunit [Actinoplanes solisilvae]